MFCPLKLVKSGPAPARGSACYGGHLQPEKRASGSLGSLAKPASLPSHPTLYAEKGPQLTPSTQLAPPLAISGKVVLAINSKVYRQISRYVELSRWLLASTLTAVSEPNMGSAVGVPLVARFMPLRELASLRRGLSAQSEAETASQARSGPPTAIQLIFDER